MSEQNEESKRKPWGCAVAALVALPISYALALGPAAWLHANSSRSIQNALETIFMPLLLVVEAAGDNYFIESFFKPYVEWWEA